MQARLSTLSDPPEIKHSVYADADLTLGCNYAAQPPRASHSSPGLKLGSDSFDSDWWREAVGVLDLNCAAVLVNRMREFQGPVSQVRHWNDLRRHGDQKRSLGRRALLTPARSD